MTNALNLANILVNIRRSIQKEKTNSNLSRASKQIRRLKKEHDSSFPEFDDVQGTLATYNLYRQLETLQQQIDTQSKGRF